MSLYIARSQLAGREQHLRSVGNESRRVVDAKFTLEIGLGALGEKEDYVECFVNALPQGFTDARSQFFVFLCNGTDLLVAAFRSMNGD